jgi:hypothetical protein
MARKRAIFGATAVVWLAGALMAAGPAAAQSLYVCTDRTGKTHTGAFPPPECQNVEVRELRPDGSVRRRIPPPETAEQRAQREAEEKRQIQAAEQRRVQMRKDLTLLEAYASEDEIETARNRALADRQASIARAQKRVDDFKRERKRLDSEREFYAKRDPPEKLKRALADNNALTRSEEKIIAEAKAEMMRINERYDTDLKRWRELVSAGARPVERVPGSQ